MVCPLCGQRRARRACPALGHDICAVCCGTKRLVEISCPETCSYLTSAREHPPAVAVRRQQHDLDTALQLLRDFNQRQSQIFFVLATFIVRYQPPELQALLDEDVADAASALAATLETAARGVIYEHHATTAPGARLAAALKAVLLEAGQRGGTPFERDAAVVLRRIEDAARHRAVSGPAPGPDNAAAGGPRALIDLLGRVIRKTAEDNSQTPPAEEPPRLIVP